MTVTDSVAVCLASIAAYACACLAIAWETCVTTWMRGVKWSGLVVVLSALASSGCVGCDPFACRRTCEPNVVAKVSNNECICALGTADGGVR